MNKKKVVFDVDDILWPLNEKMVKMANVKLENIVTYAVKENPLLTKEEQDRVYNAYMNVNLFDNMNWYEGIERINQLDANTFICSNVFEEIVAQKKKEQLMKVLTIPEENYIFHIMKNVKEKQLPNDIFILVDDSPYNLRNSNAKYNLTLRRPWNTSIYEANVIKGKNILWFDNLNEIINKIEELLKE